MLIQPMLQIKFQYLLSNDVFILKILIILFLIKDVYNFNLIFLHLPILNFQNMLITLKKLLYLFHFISPFFILFIVKVYFI